MITGLTEELAATRDLVDTVARMEADGWGAIQHAAVVTLTRGGDARTLVEDLRKVRPAATEARLIGRFGSHSLTLVVGSDGGLIVTDQSPGDLAEEFARSDLDEAQDAWDGNPEAALALTGVWCASTTIDLSHLLRLADDSRDWYVLRQVAELEGLIKGTPIWELGSLLDPGRQVVFLVKELPVDSLVRSANVQILPLEPGVIPRTTAGADPVISLVTHQVPVLRRAASPEALAPLETSGTALDAVASYLWRACAAMSWAALATDVTIDTDRRSVILEIFGFQRVTHAFGHHGPEVTDDQACATYDLYRWVRGPDATDQMLAVRQVASLYRELPPWAHARDVRRAAEPVFLALRGDAVSEVFKAQREARVLALTVAQKTADAVASLAKGAVERCLAALLAVGGVIIARSSSALTLEQAADLRRLLAVFFLALGAWSLVVEGPPVTAPVRTFKADLGTFSDLLSAEDRKRVLSLSSIAQARKQARVARIAVPIAYVLAASVAILVG